jgi:peptidoglycan/xylan/chitin deacetylase (PgdA/CDA1 family)
MRVDRLLTLYFFHPAINLLGRNNALQIPILMYHGISDHVDKHLHPYYRTVTTPKRFEQHMRFLNDNGYHVLTLSEAAQRLQDSSVNPANQNYPMVVITFDDGLQDFYSVAFPVLEKFGFKATVFLASGLIGKTFLNGSVCLNEVEIRELSDKGIEFGSHTVNHPQLKVLPKHDVANELASSKHMIEAIIGKPVQLFSYPYCFPEEDKRFTEMLSTLLSEQGYSVEVTTIIGTAKTNDDPLFLKRLPINEDDDTRFFKAKLEGGYNWLHTAQLAYKKLRGQFPDKAANAAMKLSTIKDG